MIPHHDTGAVGVHRADVSEGRRFNQEGRAVAGLRENGEIRTDFAAHDEETLVGPLHVQFGASGEVEFRHVKGHGGWVPKQIGGSNTLLEPEPSD